MSLFSPARLSKPLSFGVLLSLDALSQQTINFDLKSLWNKAPTDNERFCPKRQRQAGTTVITSCSGKLFREKALTLCPTEDFWLKIFLQSPVQRDHRSVYLISAITDVITTDNCFNPVPPDQPNIPWSGSMAVSRTIVKVTAGSPLEERN